MQHRMMVIMDGHVVVAGAVPSPLIVKRQHGDTHVKTNMRLLTLVAAMVLFVASAQAITIPTVPIGNPGNPDDFAFGFNEAFGGVAYDYRIGKTEITNDQYVTFLNAVAATDLYQLYSNSMTSAPEGGIMRSGSPGSYTYAVKSAALNGAYIYGNKPVVYVSWYDAIRFANWLHNGQGGPGTTEDGAYTLLGGTPTPSNGDSITRNPGATWWLPSEDEWYKAAYHRNNGATSNYWLYPTGLAPNNNPPSADTGRSATYFFTNGTINPRLPADRRWCVHALRQFLWHVRSGGQCVGVERGAVFERLIWHTHPARGCVELPICGRHALLAPDQRPRAERKRHLRFSRRTPCRSRARCDLPDSVGNLGAVAMQEAPKPGRDAQHWSTDN
jgi:hypothetical protein